MKNIANLFKGLFGKNSWDKPKAVAFVDYEHWYISMEKIYGLKPNIQGWVKSLNEKFDIKEITFFADFANSSLSNEIPRIREVTNNIIQTTNAGSYYKKDFTDFIMLDHIYQRAMAAHDVDSFIIFSGDGHFSSVVSCLKNYCKKEVGIYGVRDAFSNQLKNTATWFEEVPSEKDVYGIYYQMILNNLKNLEDKRYAGMKPTFAKTVEMVSAYNNVSQEIVKESLNKLIEEGYIDRSEEILSSKKHIMVLKVKWNVVTRDNLWTPESNKKRVQAKTNTKPINKNNSNANKRARAVQRNI